VETNQTFHSYLSFQTSRRAGFNTWAGLVVGKVPQTSCVTQCRNDVIQGSLQNRHSWKTYPDPVFYGTNVFMCEAEYGMLHGMLRTT
jgi:hypothetical protein